MPLPIRAFTKTFFDSAPVVAAVDAATRKKLNHGGNYIKRTAQNSIKTTRVKQRELSPEQRVEFRAKVASAKAAGLPKPKLPRTAAVSKPGSPPFSVTGKLKKHLYAGFDTTSRSVVIGPALLNAVTGQNQPAILERGGAIKIRERRFGPNGAWWPLQNRRTPRHGEAVRTRTVYVAARPYMAPALAKNIHRIPAQFANSIR